MPADGGLDLADAVGSIDPASCSYEERVQVGMALHAEGYPCSLWEEWSRRDGARYHEGECERKWSGFGRAGGKPVAGGTIVQMARDAGWAQPRDEGHALDWDDLVEPERGPRVVVDPSWVEPVDIREPDGDGWDPARETASYLEALFDAEDIVGYVTNDVWEKDGRWLPGKGSYTHTAGELISELSRCGGDIGAVLGDCKPEAGAWVRFNPLDGEGVRNDNVAEFRYALVESDSMDVGRQKAIIEELELPVAALVHSGNKSLHAIVRVDAGDYGEYRKRVDYLYDVCRKNGLALDTQNKNPSRLSRLPGVVRNGRKQFLMATGIGKESWAEWREWIEAVNDDLPDPESMADVWDDLPDLSPSLIDGVLRQGHKMLLAGPSKAGKSYALIELACAIAEGRDWLGFACTRGRVLYVNLELDRASCLHRFRDVYGALGWDPDHIDSIDIWNLRGKAVPMDLLAPKLIRRAAKKDYIAIIIDPIYKIITGDENSADQMARFCNQFDKVCTELGCAVVYCHHHSKGAQGGKRSMDRASGSGVFARDPDALLDMIELELTDAISAQQENLAVCAACERFMAEHGPEGWQDVISDDDRLMEKRFVDACRALLGSDLTEFLNAVYAARREAAARTAWRIDGTLREFPRFPAANLWFDYPRHRLDRSGVLADLESSGEANQWRGKQGKDRRRKTAEERRSERAEALESAFEACGFDSDYSLKSVAGFLGISEKTARRHVEEHDGFLIADGIVVRNPGA